MTKDNWKTIRVPAEAYEAAKAQKDEHSRTWGEQLVCNNTTTTEVVDVDNIVAQLEQQIDSLAFDGALDDETAERMISSLNVLEERTGKIERQLEELP